MHRNLMLRNNLEKYPCKFPIYLRLFWKIELFPFKMETHWKHSVGLSNIHTLTFSTLSFINMTFLISRCVSPLWFAVVVPLWFPGNFALPPPEHLLAPRSSRRRPCNTEKDATARSLGHRYGDPQRWPTTVNHNGETQREMMYKLN